MTNDTLRAILKGQYHASLAMLRDAVEKCPDAAWVAPTHTNACWQIAYHVLFFTHLYLHRDEKSFTPWAQHQKDVQYQSGLKGRLPGGDPSLPLFATPYTKAQVLEYWNVCDRLVDDAMDTVDLDASDCGFWWYKMGKLEHQFINIRHIQHHTAQLCDRVRHATDVGVPWVGAVTR